MLSSNNPVQPAPRTLPKRKTRTAQASSSRFYSDSWKVSTVPFEQAVSHFKMLVIDYNLPTIDMDADTEQAISELSEKQDVNYSRLDKKFESIHAIFENFMASNGSSSPKPKFSQPPSSSLHSKSFVLPFEQLTRVERWNKADLGYFDPHLDDKAHGTGEVVSVGKDVYYQNVVLFTQRIQNLVIFKGATLVKNNIATSLRGSALE